MKELVMTTMALPIVDGATRLYGIIGDPIQQVKSPEVFTARFRAAGVNALLVPMHVKPETFDDVMRGLRSLANLDGIIATVPYKSRVLPFADQLLPTGKRVGAINAMRREPDGRWCGEMFDGKGCVAGMRATGIDPRGLNIMLVGAGGAGSAIADAVAEAGAKSLRIFDLDEGKARQVVARVAEAHAACATAFGAPATDGRQVLINATPIGMAPGDGLPVPDLRLTKDLFVVDVIVKDATPLVSAAREAGCRTMSGRSMIEGQASEMARFFGLP
jgi:shikimate dehydrogenase